MWKIVVGFLKNPLKQSNATPNTVEELEALWATSPVVAELVPSLV